MPDTIKLWLLQLDILWEQPLKNLAKIDRILNKTSSTGDILFIPEMFTTGFSMNPEMLAETMDGPAVSWMKKTASMLNIAVAGSLVIKEHSSFFNRFVFATPSGKLEFYNKRHLFTMDDEEKHYVKGNERIVIEYKGWKILPQICYDLRFPVWSRNQNDYDLLVYVANWPQLRNEVWDTLLKARAMENQSYVAGINRIGTDGRMISYSGHTSVYSPKGELLFKAEDNKECLLAIDISYNDMQHFRNNFPVQKDADKFDIII